jgi:2-aminomuconate deaminase
MSITPRIEQSELPNNAKASSHNGLSRDQLPNLRRAGSLVFLSGVRPWQEDGSIVGCTPDGAGASTLDVRAQTRACVENIRRLLNAAGGNIEHLVEMTTYLVNIDDFAAYNEVYGEYFSVQGPARTTVAVHQLSQPDVLIEMKGVAYFAEAESKNKGNGVRSNGQR